MSWITAERGFLMLGDLLPRDDDNSNVLPGGWRVRINLPSMWNAFSSEAKGIDGQYDVREIANAVFFVGRDLRESRERIGRLDFILITEGAWAFSDNDVVAMATRILNEYGSKFANGVGPRVALMLSHFPFSVGTERWSAETRGHTITLLSGQSPSKIAGLAQLSTPLTHELFHFWVPNGLSLRGDYAWFYEGFTLYEALVVSLRLGFLTFEDYVNTMGRTFEAYLSVSDGNKFSLIEASQRRWTGPLKLVYQKGLLVAFLYDLSLRYSTKGKRSLEDVYREFFMEAVARGLKSDGNEVVLAYLKRERDLEGFVRSYVESADAIDLKSMISPFGLSANSVGNRTQILVSDKLNRRQRDLLSAFGYNADTRKARNRVS
jgi:hypothetical protein